MKNFPLPPYTLEELDRQYNARATVDDVAIYVAQYEQASKEAKRRLECVEDVQYGSHPDETLDVFPATEPGSPVYVFIHGGYWRAMSKNESSFMAPAFVEAGAAVVALNYSLAPNASLDTIVRQCRQAVAWIYRNIRRYNGAPENIHVSGSSAGGHLVGMLVAGSWHSDFDVPPSLITSASPINGLFDLRPLVNTHINEWLGLDEESAARLSPSFHLPERGCPLVVSYAERDTDEFVRQSQGYMHDWQLKGFPAVYVPMPGTNHFDIVLALQDAGSPLTKAIFSAMSL